jgi:hypothetical protein
MELSIKNVIDQLVREGYLIDRRKYALNVVGIRNNKPASPVEFDDLLVYFYFDEDGKVKGKIVPATTDPSVDYLKTPLSDAIKTGGTAILKSGQYVNAYSIGLHKGQYSALVQRKPVTVIRDNDRDSYINYFAPTTTGIYGINIHRASRGKNNERIIGKDSAGCQVFRDEKDFDEMMVLANRHKSLYGNQFTYTLIDRRDTIKFRNTAVLVIVGLLASYSVFLYIKFRKK